MAAAAKHAAHATAVAASPPPLVLNRGSPKRKALKHEAACHNPIVLPVSSCAKAAGRRWLLCRRARPSSLPS